MRNYVEINFLCFGLLEHFVYAQIKRNNLRTVLIKKMQNLVTSSLF